MGDTRSSAGVPFAKLPDAGVGRHAEAGREHRATFLKLAKRASSAIAMESGPGHGRALVARGSFLRKGLVSFRGDGITRTREAKALRGPGFFPYLK
jgi:hypothetical protein